MPVAWGIKAVSGLKPEDFYPSWLQELTLHRHFDKLVLCA